MTKKGHKSGSKKKIQARSKTGTYSVKLTRKQKAFADELLADKKISNTEAVARTYNVSDRATAGQLATENMKNPSILMYLEENKDKAQEVITNNLKLHKSKKLGEKRLAYDSATQILDRTVGKPTQRTEVTSQHLHLSLDLTGE